MDQKTLKTKIDSATAARGKGDLKESRLMFEKLLKGFEQIPEEKRTKEFQFLYATAQAEYVIQHRLEAKELYSKALGLGKELLEYDKENKINNPLSLRSVSNTLVDLQSYEKAIHYLNKLIMLHKNNSASRGDTRAHLAYCLLRSGQVKKAETEMKVAKQEILENSTGEGYITIKHSYVLLVEALILNAKGYSSKALSRAHESFKVARSKSRVFRMKQAQEVMDYLKDKV